MPTDDRRGRVVLVVDDDPYVREVLEECLVAEGHTVHCAADGGAGLRLAAELDVDLVILDLRMPRMDGYAFLRDLQAREAPPPVLVLTATPATRVPDAVATLVKPFSIDELQAAVEKALAGQPAAETR